MTTDPHETDGSHKPGTRERLLDVAERLFAARGFAGTSVREITDGAEANLSAVNYYFRSKENLYAEVFERRIAYLRDPILAGFRDPADFTRRSLDQMLHDFGRAFLAPHQNPATCERLHGLFSREMIETSLPPGMLARELLLPMSETVTGIVRQARPDLDSATSGACAHSFLAQLMHLVRGVRVTTDAAIPVPPLDERLAFIVLFTAAAIRNI